MIVGYLQKKNLLLITHLIQSNMEYLEYQEYLD